MALSCERCGRALGSEGVLSRLFGGVEGHQCASCGLCLCVPCYTDRRRTLGATGGDACPLCAGTLRARTRAPTGGDGGRDAWAYLPATVLSVVAAAGAFTLVGIRPVVFPGGGPAVLAWNFLNRHVLNMLMHQGLGHYVGNVFLFTLFGGALGAVSSDRHVFGVVLASHVLASTAHSLVADATGIGLSLAVAALVSATAVRFGAMVLGRTPLDSADRLVGVTFALFALAFYAGSSLRGTIYVEVFDHHVYGWMAGAVVEAAWCLRRERREGFRR